MSVILQVRNLEKSYPGGVKAVAGISFEVQRGQCLGLLGPNGAGKTTTVEMMEGILRPSGGEVLYNGVPLDAGYREVIGIQFQSTALQDFLTVKENLQFFRALYQRQAPLDVLIERCRLGEFLNRDARKLSGGQRQRLLLAIALVNDPEILFLDEPTTGLDPQARRNFWELVTDIKASGKTIVLTTHYMEEADRLCDDILIVDHGQVIAQGSPRQLLRKHFEDVVLELPLELLEGAEQWPFTLLERDGLAEILTGDVNGTVQVLVNAGVPLNELRIRPRTLEDLFLELTGKEIRT